MSTKGKEEPSLHMYLGEGGDFSCNAKTDLPDGSDANVESPKVFGIRQNEKDLKYVRNFRELLLQINPHNILCSYKKMIELAAVVNLRHVEEGHGWQRVQKESNSAPTSPRAPLHDIVDRSNSCIYSSFSGWQNIRKRPGDLACDDFSSWETCKRPHTALGTTYQCNPDGSFKDCIRGTSKNSSNRMTSLIMQNIPGSIKRVAVPGASRSAQVCTSGLKDPEKPEEPIGTPDFTRGDVSHHKRGTKRFRHFKHPSHYIEQYRNEYTYRRLLSANESLPLCPCGGLVGASVAPSLGVTEPTTNVQSFSLKTESPGTTVTPTYMTSSQRNSPTPSSASFRNTAPGSADPRLYRSETPCNALSKIVVCSTVGLKESAAPKQPRDFVLVPVRSEVRRTRAYPSGCYRLGMPRMEIFATAMKMNKSKPRKRPSYSSSKTRMRQGDFLTGIGTPSPSASGVGRYFNQNIKGDM